MCKLPNFRKRLNQLLVESGNTIVAFADFLGVSRQSLGYYLNGERIPDILIFKQICERCKVSADWLLGLSDVKTPDAGIQAICKSTGLSEKTISQFMGMNKHPANRRLMKLIDAFLSNIDSRGSFYNALNRLYHAYGIKVHNLDSFKTRVIEMNEEIINIEETKRADELERMNYELHIQALSDGDIEEFEQFMSKKFMQEALDALFKSDAIERIYQEEGSKNGQS